MWITDIRDTAGSVLAQELGSEARYQRLDVREEADWLVVIEKILSVDGRIDVVVNNAGITGFEDGFVPQDPEHATLDSWHAIHRTNLDGNGSVRQQRQRAPDPQRAGHHPAGYHRPGQRNARMSRRPQHQQERRRHRPGCLRRG